MPPRRHLERESNQHRQDTKRRPLGLAKLESRNNNNRRGNDQRHSIESGIRLLFEAARASLMDAGGHLRAGGGGGGGPQRGEHVNSSSIQFDSPTSCELN